MQHYLAIALGGALGSVLRFALNEAVSDRFGRAFPWGTLGINVIGSFLIGLLAIL
ncbi:MAG TPA: CrcB family protein, partial [Thioalkalivibrio sp.]|nr:CrcB family protein [Thioalkalivibrio sp.]